MDRISNTKAINCGACGGEFMSDELSTVKLSGFQSVLRVCDSCKSKEPQEHYKTAASILKDISEIASVIESPEDRLAKIKQLLGE